MGDLITLNCPSCGGKLEVDENTSLLTCEHCGTEHIVNRAGGSVTLESHARCPICRRNDKVEKITSLLRKENQDSQLAMSLAAPQLPDDLPQPSLKPKPELFPKPEPLSPAKHKPKPLPLEKPKLMLTKPKTQTLIFGIILLVLGYFFLAVMIGMLIEEWDTAVASVLLCCTSAPILIGIFLMYKGYTSKQYFPSEYINSEEFTNTNMDERKNTIKTIAIVGISLFIAISCLVFSFTIFLDDIGGLLFAISFSLLPLLVGLFYLLTRNILKRIRNANQIKLEKYQQVMDEWQKNNEIITQKWEQENEQIFEEWKNKNQAIEKEWQIQNDTLLKAWNEVNDRITKAWEKENASVLRDWHTAVNRWENLYFCHRDDVIFIPGEGTYATIEKLNEYL